MHNKNDLFQLWDTKENSLFSTKLIQPNAAASGIAARSILSSMAPYELHKRLINDYILCRKGATSLLQRDTSRDKTDYDVIRENHRFLWEDEDNPDTWEAQLAKKYYDKLFKEYCICDLSKYKHNKVAMRWRTEAELVSGRGQFTCGEKHCNGRDTLRTWEVNFAYQEQGEKKNALVKLRLCPNCTSKLNYHTMKREVKRKQKKDKKKRKHSTDSEEEPKAKNQKRKEKRKQNTLETSDDITKDVDEGTSTSKDTGDDESQVWKEAAKPDEEKSREDEFEEYLEDLFM